MIRVASVVSALRTENLRLAQTGCAVAHVVKDDLTPKRLDGAQTGLRQQLLHVESRIRTLKARRNARGKRLARFFRNSATRASALEHVAALKEVERQLQILRQILRQFGDSYAWLVLNQDARMIAALSAERTHHLPAGLGLAGPSTLARNAHESERFLVIENDLTRCLGIGDLTVVPFQAAWHRPLVLEVKTSGEWRLGAEMTIGCCAIRFHDPASVALWESFQATLEMKDLPEGQGIREVPEQTQEMLSRAELIVNAVGTGDGALVGSDSGAWRTIANVLRRAWREGECFDQIEPGVVVFAVRVPGDRPALERAAEVTSRIRELGYGKQCLIITAERFMETDAWASFAPPIPLWPVSIEALARLMAGELYFACVFDPNVWGEAMKEHRLTLEVAEGEWKVEGSDGTSIGFDGVEVAKLGLGLAFSGVSPRVVAAGVAAKLRELTQARSA